MSQHLRSVVVPAPGYFIHQAVETDSGEHIWEKLAIIAWQVSEDYSSDKKQYELCEFPEALTIYGVHTESQSKAFVEDPAGTFAPLNQHWTPVTDLVTAKQKAIANA